MEFPLPVRGLSTAPVAKWSWALSGMMHRITGLQGKSQYNADDYGPVLARAHGVGLTLAEFQTQIMMVVQQQQGGAQQPQQLQQAKSYVYHSNEWFASALGLTVIQTKEERKPVTASSPLYSKSMDKTIPVGHVTGMTVIATTTTKEGVTIQSEQIGKCYDNEKKEKGGGDKDATEWKFLGEPAGVNFSMDSPPTPQMTNTAGHHFSPGPNYRGSTRICDDGSF
jgi:hypothetical protein